VLALLLAAAAGGVSPFPALPELPPDPDPGALFSCPSCNGAAKEIPFDFRVAEGSRSVVVRGRGCVCISGCLGDDNRPLCFLTAEQQDAGKAAALAAWTAKYPPTPKTDADAERLRKAEEKRARKAARYAKEAR
jgi:hypothetical protein